MIAAAPQGQFLGHDLGQGQKTNPEAEIESMVAQVMRILVRGRTEVGRGRDPAGTVETEGSRMVKEVRMRKMNSVSSGFIKKKFCSMSIKGEGAVAGPEAGGGEILDSREVLVTVGPISSISLEDSGERSLQGHPQGQGHQRPLGVGKRMMLVPNHKLATLEQTTIVEMVVLVRGRNQQLTSVSLKASTTNLRRIKKSRWVAVQSLDPNFRMLCSVNIVISSTQ